MYRQYENPHELEKRLKELKEELDQAYAFGSDPYDLQDLHLEIHELEDRINHAWQDDEYDSECSQNDSFYADLLMEQREQM